MRKLTFFLTLLVLAAIGWGAYWYIGARAMEGAYRGWLDDRRAEGWVAEAEVKTEGMPNRFDTSFTGLKLADPVTGTGWSTPLFQLFSLSYKPNHVILYWPGEQHVALPDQALTVTADSFRGSMQVAPTLALPLIETVIAMNNWNLTSTKGWDATLGDGQLAMRQTPGADPAAHRYDLALTVNNLDPGQTFLALTRDISGLPQMVDGVQIEASVDFDRDWDRRALEERRPQPRQVSLDKFEAQWGGLKLTGTGTLEVDAAGQPSGSLDLKATQWRDMLALARATGAIGPQYDAVLTRGLELLAALSGDPDVLDLPLSFQNGFSFLGPVPLGPAPIIALP